MAPGGIRAGLHWLAQNPGVAPVLALFAVAVVLAGLDGGYAATNWYPAALGLLGLLVTLMAAAPPRAVPRTVVAAALLLFGFACWSLLSVTWADQQGQAWDAANRALLYTIVFALAALWPLRGSAAMALLAVFGLAVAVMGTVELLRAAAADDPSGYFVYAQLSEPVGYQNANVALWMMGLVPCVFIASRREAHPLLRGACLAGAGMLVALAAMGQSRSWLVALPVVAIAFVALTRGRGRVLTTVLLLAVAALLYLEPVLAVYDDWELGQPLAPLLDDAVARILPVVAGLGVAGTLLALLDGRIRAPERIARRASAAVTGTAALALVVAGAAFFAAGDGSARISDAWDEFKAGDRPNEGYGLGDSVGSNRYEFWTVAWERFEDEPLKGIGAGNFLLDYLRAGRSGEQPRYPHSLEIGVLSQTGLVGIILVGAALACALLAGLGAVRRAPPLAAAAAGASMATFAWWFAQGSVDWFWEFPGLGIAAFAMLGLAAALLPRAAQGSRVPDGRPHARTVLVGAGVVLGIVSTLAVAISFSRPWLAARDVRHAGEVWREDPQEALDRLDRAADLNPVSPDADLVAGTIALRLGRNDIARRQFGAALEREPLNPYPTFELGLIEAEEGRRQPAERLLRRAVRLAPRDPISARALSDLRQGRRMRTATYNRQILRDARKRIDEAG